VILHPGHGRIRFVRIGQDAAVAGHDRDPAAAAGRKALDHRLEGIDLGLGKKPGPHLRLHQAIHGLELEAQMLQGLRLHRPADQDAAGDHAHGDEEEAGEEESPVERRSPVAQLTHR